MIIGIIILLAVNITFLTISSRRRYSSYQPGRITLFIVAPFQEIVTQSLRFVRDVWNHYFFLVAVAKENQQLKRQLSIAVEKNRQLVEIELSNERLRNLLNFQKNVTERVLAAEVIGKDPSPWFKTIIVDKGSLDGVKKGLPVVIPEGIVGQVIEVSSRHSKVLLIIDTNSAVDALIQRTRFRGLIKGSIGGKCLFKYVLRKHDIRVGDTVISSGLDGVYPKGLSIGKVFGVIRRNAGIFQEVTVTPYVDFEKIEEVLIVMNPGVHELFSLR
ncbi:MAG: rod shape-determining protein MreC [Deltaproteobacteria bacterium]|nr:rod shape-determining protein MreC [Deltaproteobacteria bacterium]MBW1962959.1 rod shape-determining protein MreC [Deltaproteobacteria bacterium]MBW1993957.1 rod shape-determining protein MreC [Deltaproteobacteria bacterium]MBW2153083.1 rod shape-determining protein MreC [Deltaproteobacteria bacterium]